jgi:hypothetical protein
MCLYNILVALVIVLIFDSNAYFVALWTINVPLYFAVSF